MQHRRNLLIPDTLADVCDPDRIALIVYDMQVGVVRQLADGPQVTERVGQVLEAARRAAVRVFFTRHMTLPTELMGVSQLRAAMAWQRKDRVEDVASPFLRDSPGVRDRARAPPARVGGGLRQALDVPLRGHPVGVRAARRPGHRVRDRRRRDGGRASSPRVRHGADRGLIPVLVTDACGAGNPAAARRSLDALATAGDAILTDISTITGLLAARHAKRPSVERTRAPQEVSR